MKKLSFLIGIIAVLSYQPLLAQKIKSYSANDINARTSNKDTVYVVNFWATWCIPCVKELPEFNAIYDLYKHKPVKIILVSFDFKEQYPAKLTAWVHRKKLLPEVVWLNETNPNNYIPKLAPSWEGGLPATILINNKTGERLLKPREITAGELKLWIDKQL